MSRVVYYADDQTIEVAGIMRARLDVDRLIDTLLQARDALWPRPPRKRGPAPGWTPERRAAHCERMRRIKAKRRAKAA